MRETGPVRKDISGEEAVPYIGYARTALGQLKNYMQFGGLQQGKMTRQLPDGTTVVVSSVHGQDKIAISKPVSTEEEKPVEQFEQKGEEVSVEQPEVKVPFDETQVRSVFVAGGASNSNDNPKAWYWSQRSGTIPIETPGEVSYPLGISGNGRVVVGAYRVGSKEYAFWWNATDGVCHTLPVLNGASQQTINMATGCNFDGSIIVGVGRNHAEPNTSYVNWVWTKAHGMIELPGSYWQDNTWVEPKISPNGRFVSGTGVWYPTTYYYQSHGPAPVTLEQTYAIEPTGRVWRLTNGIPDAGMGLPGSGTYTHFTMSYFGTLNFSYDIENQSFPLDVCDAGIACGGGGFVNAAGNAFLFNIGSGLYRKVSTHFGAYAITNDGGRVAGISPWNDSGVYTVNVGEVPVPNAQIYDMTSDGIQYVGGSGQDSGGIFFAYHFQLKSRVPKMWSGAAGEQIMPLLPGKAWGWVECIAAPRLHVSTDPEVSPSSSV